VEATSATPVEAPQKPATHPGFPPGPSAARAIQTARLIGRPIPFFESCRRRYGEPFRAKMARIGEAIFISDPPSLKRLFGADRENTIAPGRNNVLAPILGVRSVLILEGNEHLRRRKLMLPSFHGERMRAYEQVMAEAADRTVEGWPIGERFRLHRSMQAITLEVIIRAVFGIEDEDRRERLRRLLRGIVATTQSPVAFAFTFPGMRRLRAFRRTERMLAETDGILLAEIAERRADPNLDERDDILSLLVAARFDDGEGMNDRELRDQLMTLLLAGHETTATALAWSFDLLFRAPEKLERLQTEIRDGEGTYLDAVIKEALRVRPVVPFVGRELEVPMELGGYELPAGAIAMACIYLTHTRADVYDDPYAFKPERFLDGGPETFSWIPFGGGTRRCLGASFAEFEMAVVLRRVLSRATVRPATDDPEPIVRRNVTLAPRNGTPAILERRD
jgi:cytochrome P450 family 135